MENFDRENIDELLEIRQYFPHQNFALYGNLRKYSEWNVKIFIMSSHAFISQAVDMTNVRTLTITHASLHMIHTWYYFY